MPYFPVMNVTIQILIYFIITLLLVAILKIKKREAYIIILCFLIKIIIAMLFYVTRDNPYGTYLLKDELYYLVEAKAYLDQGLIPIETLFSRNKGFIFFNWLHYYIFNDANIIYVLITNCFIGILTWLFFLGELESLFNKENLDKLLLFLMLIPDLVFHEIQNMRDTLIVFGLMMSIKIINVMCKSTITKSIIKNISNLIKLLFLFFLSTVLRFYNGIIILVTFGFQYILSKKALIKKLFIIITTVIIVVFINKFFPSIYSYINYILEGGISNIYHRVYLDTINIESDFFIKTQLLNTGKYNFKIFIMTILSFYITPNPLTFFHQDFFTKLIILSNLFMISLIPYIMRAFIKFKHKSNIERTMILIVIFYSLVITLSPFLGDYRHRAQIMPLLFILAFKEIQGNNKTIVMLYQILTFTLFLSLLIFMY